MLGEHKIENPPSKASDIKSWKNSLGNSGRVQSVKGKKPKSPVAGLAKPKAIPASGSSQSKITWDQRLTKAMKGMK